MSTHLDSQPDTNMPRSEGNSFIRRAWRARKVRVGLALAIILFFVLLALLQGLFASPAQEEPTTATGDMMNVTVTVTHPVGSLRVNRSVTFKGVHITVTTVEEALSFSDDRKRAGNYTLRVLLQEKTDSATAVGIDYASVVRLVLPDGQVVAPKLVGLSPAVLQNELQSGFIDFPLATQMPLSSMTLRFDNEVAVAFGR